MYSWLEAYLNNKTTREILGVDSSVGKFQLSNLDVKSLFWVQGDHTHQTYQYVAELLNRGIRVLIYAGTYDWICNWVSVSRDLPVGMSLIIFFPRWAMNGWHWLWNGLANKLSCRNR